MNVAADDTTSVVVNGTQIVPPNFTTTSACDQTIGCTAGNVGTFATVATSNGSGVITIAFDVYQQSGDGIGLQYAGTVSAVPIPAALPLMLSALGGLGLIARRRKSETV